MKTFDEWSSLGFKIKKGSKAHWVNNVAMFDKTQVTKHSDTKNKKSQQRYSPYDAPSYLWESVNANDFDDYLGI